MAAASPSSARSRRVSIPSLGRKGVAFGVALTATVLLLAGVIGNLTGHVHPERRVAILEGADAFHFADELPIQLGDHGIFFLHDFERTGRYGMVSQQGVYLADGAQVRDSRRADPLVRRLEQLSMTSLHELVRQANVAGEAGTVKALRPGEQPLSRSATRTGPGTGGGWPTSNTENADRLERKAR